jgi:putative glutamine amidotransferase
MTRTRKPLIGVTPDTHGGSRIRTRAPTEKVLYVYDMYVRAVQDHGAVAAVLPVTLDRRAVRDTLVRLDGLLLIGGNFDVPPELYGEQPIPQLGIVKRARSEYELELIAAALRRSLPILGICGGMQAVNVALGGSLYQDLQTQRPRSREHQQAARKDRISHRVTVEPRTLLHRIVSRTRGRRPLRIGVNSTHHQAIKAVGRGLTVNARAADGIVEGIESAAHEFVLGVQWHPELLYATHETHARLFRALVRAARRFGAARCSARQGRST